MKSNYMLRTTLFMALIPFIAISQKSAINRKKHGPDSHPSTCFFTTDLKTGDKLGNVFSRTISFAGDGFQEIVYRFGGTGIYTVTNPKPGHHTFNGVFRYDGNPIVSNKLEISDNGKTAIYDGKKGTNTDGSGLIFNQLIWGIPPAELHPGTTWTVNISQPWELGGAGVQMVRVMEIDPYNHSIRLKREGTSDGYFDNDIKQIIVTRNGKSVKVNVEPGKASWSGYTTFKNGLVISDELLVTRPVTLHADSLNIQATQRQYILLNSMPTDNS